MSQPTEPRTPDQNPPAAPQAAAGPTRLSRRHALGGVAGVGIGLPLLAACGDDGSTAADPGATQTPATADGPSADGSGDGGSGTQAANPSFASTDDVPVGGGALFPDEGLVVTQPTDGEFLGFSITCTHQGCPVDSVTENGISCPCHGSIFDLASGAPMSGPANAPLAPVQLALDGDQISRA